jgi:hypothetical protein
MSREAAKERYDRQPTQSLSNPFDRLTLVRAVFKKIQIPSTLSSRPEQTIANAMICEAERPCGLTEPGCRGGRSRFLGLILQAKACLPVTG